MQNSPKTRENDLKNALLGPFLRPFEKFCFHARAYSRNSHFTRTRNARNSDQFVSKNREAPGQHSAGVWQLPGERLHSVWQQKKPTFALIPQDLPTKQSPLRICALFDPSPGSSLPCFSIPCFSTPCSLIPVPCLYHSVSGLGRITSRTIAFISATAAMNWRSVRRVDPKLSNSAGVRPISL